jgi:hypothetical protein
MGDPDRLKIWQVRWHEILNGYPDPDGGASVTLDPLPDMSSDFRLHFNMWQAPQQARQDAFAIFPCGDEMLARVDRHLSSRRIPLDPEQAVGLLRSGLQLAQDAGVTTLPAPEIQIDVLSERDIPMLDAFKNADDPFDEVRDQLSASVRARTGEIGLDAYYFLSEPLYRLRSSYHPADWVRWPLCSNLGTADLTEVNYLLAEGAGPRAGRATGCSFSTGARSSA